MNRKEYLDISFDILKDVRDEWGVSRQRPKFKSSHGKKIDKIEAITRSFPLWAILSHACSESDEIIILEDFGDFYKKVLHSIFNRDSRDYLGDPNNYHQYLVEAADLALGLYISKDHFWDTLDQITKESIASWLTKAFYCKFHDSNWLLFKALIGACALELGIFVDKSEIKLTTSRFFEFFRDSGWISDIHPNYGFAYDYYTSWQMYYSLYWIKKINQRYLPRNFSNELQEFSTHINMLATPKGLPVFGRSIIYRFAIPCAPLVASLMHGGNYSFDAKSTLDTLWGFLLKNGAYGHGKFTSGYLEQDYSIIDTYSGPNSVLWGTRVLVLAFLHEETDQFWNSNLLFENKKVSDFEIVCGSTLIILSGDSISGNTRVSRKGGFRSDKYLKNNFRRNLHKPLFKRGSGLKNCYSNEIYTTERLFWKKEDSV